MNVLSKVLLLGVLSLGASAVQAYTLSNDNSGNGSVEDSYPSFTLLGSDYLSDPSSGPSLTSYSQTFDAPTVLSFNWVFTTRDVDGGAFDKAGYVLNDDFTQLSIDTLFTGESNSGTTTVTIAAGQTFGWYIDSFDQFFGRGELKVTAIPLPASAALFASGLLGFAASRRKKTQM